MACLPSVAGFLLFAKASCYTLYGDQGYAGQDREAGWHEGNAALLVFQELQSRRSVLHWLGGIVSRANIRSGTFYIEQRRAQLEIAAFVGADLYGGIVRRNKSNQISVPNRDLWRIEHRYDCAVLVRFRVER